MGDWMISKKRYWGLALPIWVDDEDPTDFEVIGSREELKERAVEGWEEFDGHTPHRPWVDKVKIRNPKTGNLMSRIPDVGNPWLDAGIVAFSTMGYNTRPRRTGRSGIPADFITESFPGQFRNWFYALLAMSTMMSDGEPPFKTLLGHGLVRDQNGEEMHKSEGQLDRVQRGRRQGRRDHGPEGEAAAVQRDGRGRDALAVLPAQPGGEPQLRPRPGERGAGEVRSSSCGTPTPSSATTPGDGFDPADAAGAGRGAAGHRPLDPLGPAAADQDGARGVRELQRDGLLPGGEEFIETSCRTGTSAATRPVPEQGRRTRRRRAKDKLAAYQTLYTVLTTLCKLIAPSCRS